MARAVIAGTGMYAPDRVVTNFDLAKSIDTSDEWIRQRTGIVERRFARDHETPASMAAQATKNALEMSGLKPTDLDLIIVATHTSQHPIPGTASFLQHALGLSSTPVFDLRAQCTGFLYSLNVGRAFIEAGIYKNILVCGVELQSRALDFSNRGRDMAVLFGDGAGAVILQASQDKDRGLIDVVLHSQGEHAQRLWTEYPAIGFPDYMTKERIDEGRIFPQMDGKFVFKNAVVRIPEALDEVFQVSGLKAADVNHYFFHQANLRINEAIAERYSIPSDRVYNNIMSYGNCSAASIPMLLDEVNRQSKIKPGDLLAFAAFGSGFSWGAALLRW